MLVNVDIAEVYECDYKIANYLMKNGWVMLHSYTAINSFVGDVADAKVRYALFRPKSINYTVEMAVDELNERCPF